VRAACGRFPFRTLASESANHRFNFYATGPGTLQPTSLQESRPILDSSFPSNFQPASWLGKKRQQAAALQSFAPNASMLALFRTASGEAAGHRSVPGP